MSNKIFESEKASSNKFRTVDIERAALKNHTPLNLVLNNRCNTKNEETTYLLTSK